MSGKVKLEKINYVKSIGRFYDVNISSTPTSSSSFEEFSLIYADNGTGKSTLSTILKSLWRNNPEILIEKKTIGATDESSVSLEVNGKNYKFENGQWNNVPEIPIEIFDEEFVNKNVFSANDVNLENRRGLFDIVLGKENVEKVEKIQNYTKLIENDLKTKIESSENKLKEVAGINDIADLDNTEKLDDTTLDVMRDNLNKNTNIIKYVERIEKEKNLQNINEFEKLPYVESISKTLGSLSLAAEYKAHIQVHNEWIQDGMNKLENEESKNCLFCFQNIENNDAIKAYKTFFSEEYTELRMQVDFLISSVDRIYSDAVIKNMTDLIAYNNERCVFWNELDETIKPFDISIPLKETAGILKNALKKVLEKKKSNLLEAVLPDEGEVGELNKSDVLRTAIANYNLSVNNMNIKIQALKDKTQDIQELRVRSENDRIKIKCNEVGYKNEETSKLYTELKQYRKEKENAEANIINIRKEIDESSIQILEDYKNTINKELENFGAEFSIVGFKRKADSSREESVHFNICLKGESFSPSGSGNSPYKLSNTLSAGDKSTLAFAFFIAKYHGKDVSNQILVFDDPITSLDFFRKMQTRHAILQFCKREAQVIVLTHSIEFAKLFSNRIKGRFIQIMKNDSKSGLTYTPFNKFSEMSTVKYDHNHNLIQKYLDDPASVKRLDVMRSVRPYVETTISQYRPKYSTSSLGGMIASLKTEGNICDEYIGNLEIINDTITSESSHGGSDMEADDYENITDSELMTVCKKALEIVAPPLKQS